MKYAHRLACSVLGPQRPALILKMLQTLGGRLALKFILNAYSCLSLITTPPPPCAQHGSQINRLQMEFSETVSRNPFFPLSVVCVRCFATVMWDLPKQYPVQSNLSQLTLQTPCKDPSTAQTLLSPHYPWNVFFVLKPRDLTGLGCGGKVHEYKVQGSSPLWRILPASNLLRYP